ncbi:MAG TPA: CHAT domain-containing protein [Thermoanaerobaculia bacterium]|nr:CHAT domain-containing protein [Thermoanaerobaculia bacterium]
MEVVAVAAGGLGAAAGVAAGDVVVSWGGEASEGGAVSGIADWVGLERQVGPVGVVVLSLEGAAGSRQVPLPPGRWAIRVAPRLQLRERPPLAEELAWLRGELDDEAVAMAGGAQVAACAAAATDEGLRWWAHHAAAERLAEAGRDEPAERAWAAAAASPDPRLRLTTLERVVRHRVGREDAEAAAAALAAFERAVAGAGGAFPLASARARFLAGRVAQLREHLEESQRAFQEALEQLEPLAPASLERLETLYHLGVLARRRGQLEQAEGYLTQALAVGAHADPRGPLVAYVRNGLGLVAWRRGELDAAEAHLREALAAMEVAEVPARTRAVALSNLGLVARDRGDLVAAEEYLRQALATEEPQAGAAGSWSLAMILNTVGMVAADRGDLEGAQAAYGRALRIVERVAPGGAAAASISENLGLVALEQGQHELAEPALRRSLEIKQQLAGDPLEEAMALANLARVHLERHELDAAEALYLRSLALKEAVAPDNLVVSNTLVHLGHIARRRGDLALARERHQRALALRRGLHREGVFVADSLREVALLAAAEGDLAAAEAQLRQAVAIGERLAPFGLQHARSLYELGRLERRLGRRAAAAVTLLRALDALEAQVGRLGVGSEAAGEYRSHHLELYRQAIEVLLELGRCGEAFHVLERSRARMLLVMLAERDLVFAADVPPELEQHRLRLASELDQLQAELRQSPPEGLGRLEERMAALRAEREAVREQVRRLAPQLAELRDPRPLDAAAVRRGLEPGTVLAAYSVGDEGTDLFLLTAEALEVVRLQVGEEALAAAVERFRRLLQHGRWGGTANAAELLSVSGDLYRWLLAPIEGALEANERLVVVPDGPLLLLPFAALARDTPGGAQFLIERLPVSVSHSATVLARLRDRRERAPDAGRAQLVAFADPSDGGELEGGWRDAAYPLEPLPASRDEVAALLNLFPERSVGYLGAEATESRAKAVGDTRYLHFATHALLNERYPLSSALVLRPSPFGGDNGLLQVWEVFEQVRLAADLVVLSACETALGADVRGEGLVGFTRAFHYAGAASVVASLWRVGDLSTARLMKRFYGYLRAGMPKDAALAAAQGDLLRDPAVAHPYHWAGFVLHGDWR